MAIAMMVKEGTFIEALMNELESMGVNIAELRKLHERGHQNDAVKESLVKLYQTHKFTTYLA